MAGTTQTQGGSGEDPNDKYPVARGADHQKPADEWGERQNPVQNPAFPATNLK